MLALPADMRRSVAAHLHPIERCVLRHVCVRLKQVLAKEPLSCFACYHYCIENDYVALLMHVAPRLPTIRLQLVLASYAAKNGALHILRYMRTRFCRWDSSTCTCAAANGHLHVLRYLHENRCQWSAQTCYEAARYGHLDCLQYARIHGCDWRADTVSRVLEYCQPALFAQLNKRRSSGRSDLDTLLDLQPSRWLQ